MISIIIPVYNKEKYIKKCLESITNQTYKNIEIIVINDGSTDNSENIIKEFAKKEKRIKVFTQSNGGVSKARNQGLKYASGEYILFVDADDYVEADYVEKMVAYKEDLIVCGYINVQKNGNKINYIKNKVFYDKNEIIKNSLKKENNSLMVTPYVKLFKHNIITKNNLNFDETMNFGEDTCFVFEYIKNIKSMRFIEYYGYYNINVQGTLSRRYVSNIKEQTKKVYNVIKSFDINEREYFIYWYFRNIKLILFNEKNKKYDSFKENVKIIKNDSEFKNIKSNDKFLSKTDKIIYKLIEQDKYLILYWLYKIFK